MKTFVRNICLLFLVTGAVTNIALAQTDAPAGTNAPRSAMRMPASKRFSGKIASVDTNAMSFTLEGPVKDEVLVSSTTRLTLSKTRQPATFADLAVGLQVNGMKRQNASSNWVASTVLVGPPRVIPPSRRRSNSLRACSKISPGARGYAADGPRRERDLSQFAWLVGIVRQVLGSLRLLPANISLFWEM